LRSFRQLKTATCCQQRLVFEHWRQVPSPSNTLWVMPEIGTTHKYKLSCFPNICKDTAALGKDIQKIGQQKSPC
jgi:hypothetical protein